MTDAPQRIWATTNGRRTRFHLGGETGGYLGSLIGGWCEHKDKDWAHEYIRADLAPTDAQVMAHPKVRALVEALRDIADPARLTSHGDPTVLRNRARAALRDMEDSNG